MAFGWTTFNREKAREAMQAGNTHRVGLVATNSIRNGANRHVLDSISRQSVIFEARSDEPWTLDGAAVRVSLVCFARNFTGLASLDGAQVATIYPDLTSGKTDLTTAKQLLENRGIAFGGIQKTGLFEMTGIEAREMLGAPSNTNGRPNSDVVRPWWNGLDVARRNRDMWIVDFGLDEDEFKVAPFALPYARLARLVKPTRVDKREARTNTCWWLFQWSRPMMRKAIKPFNRFIVTPEVSKHRVFTWAPSIVCPDKKLMVIARDDDTFFGILHSRFHEVWALRLCAWMGVGNDPCYTPSTTFETFPFPGDLTPDCPAASYAADPRAQAIAKATQTLVTARDRWLNPPEMVNIVPEVAPGFPDRIMPKDAAAEAILRKRTLTNLYNTRRTPEGAWLDNLHRTLDEAVAVAYGWPAELSDDEVLARLLALNHERAR